MLSIAEPRRFEELSHAGPSYSECERSSDVRVRPRLGREPELRLEDALHVEGLLDGPEAFREQALRVADFAIDGDATAVNVVRARQTSKEQTADRDN